MAKRHHLSEARVQTVVDGLVRELHRHGSVNALAEHLSATSGQRVYPNRIHGLLAEDASRTVTAATLEVLEAGLAASVGDGTVADGFKDLDKRVAAAVTAIPTGDDRVNAVAAALSLPPAVVRRALRDETPAASGAATMPPPGAPDWTWQDTAVSRIGESLAKPSDNRVGLIVPTGGGKTRLGLRVILERLASDSREDATAIWITHRRRLSRQARRSLQQLLKEGRHVPEDAASMFESRIRFAMIGDLAATLEELDGKVSVIVVDEAHHAAAPSYALIFASPAPALFLTATPVRADKLPIGIDRVAYTITYRELFKRNCVIEPIFDPPLDMSGLDWSTPDGLTELADYLLDRTEQDFGKVLVAVSMQERAERLYEAVVNLLDERPSHPLTTDDVAYVHGGSNSNGLADPSDALDESAGKPAGILIATSSLVGEGYDDPSIDAAVVTYASKSIAHLMQVAGRALRWAPGKKQAHVVQLRESPLQYYFDQRWLYQDISDELRPDLLDLEYGTADELVQMTQRLLEEHNVAQAVRERIGKQLQSTQPGPDVRLMLAGVNYYGPVKDFALATWNAIGIDDDEWSRFLNIFNDVSLRQEDIKEPQAFLKEYLGPDATAGSLWKSYMDLINAAEYARREINGHEYPGTDSRPHRTGSNTTWLRYVTIRYRPRVPSELEAFLADAVNRDSVLAAYAADPTAWSAATRVQLPLAGSIAYLLDDVQYSWINSARNGLLDVLRNTPLADAFRAIHGWRAGLLATPVPMPLLDNVHQLLPAPNWEAQHLRLIPTSAHVGLDL